MIIPPLSEVPPGDFNIILIKFKKIRGSFPECFPYVGCAVKKSQDPWSNCEAPRFVLGDLYA